jgi:pantetheine-phosphate adenylyltransferase
MKMRQVIFPGTFDPVTLGHLDILRRAVVLFDHVIVAVAVESSTRLFSAEERVGLLKTAASDLPNVEVVSFTGLLVDEVRRRGAAAVVRGIRSAADYDHEWSLDGMNRKLSPESEYIYLMARPEFAAVSSSLVREIVRHGGDLAPFVVPVVAEALRRKIAEG